jgi:hypothetical protein
LSTTQLQAFRLAAAAALDSITDTKDKTDAASSPIVH